MINRGKQKGVKTLELGSSELRNPFQEVIVVILARLENKLYTNNSSFYKVNYTLLLNTEIVHFCI